MSNKGFLQSQDRVNMGTIAKVGNFELFRVLF